MLKFFFAAEGRAFSPTSPVWEYYIISIFESSIHCRFSHVT